MCGVLWKWRKFKWLSFLFIFLDTYFRWLRHFQLTLCDVWSTCSVNVSNVIHTSPNWSLFACCEERVCTSQWPWQWSWWRHKLIAGLTKPVTSKKRDETKSRPCCPLQKLQVAVSPLHVPCKQLVAYQGTRYVTKKKPKIKFTGWKVSDWGTGQKYMIGTSKWPLEMLET